MSQPKKTTKKPRTMLTSPENSAELKEKEKTSCKFTASQRKEKHTPKKKQTAPKKQTAVRKKTAAKKLSSSSSTSEHEDEDEGVVLFALRKCQEN